MSDKDVDIFGILERARQYLHGEEEVEDQEPYENILSSRHKSWLLLKVEASYEREGFEYEEGMNVRNSNAYREIWGAAYGIEPVREWWDEVESVIEVVGNNEIFVREYIIQEVIVNTDTGKTEEWLDIIDVKPVPSHLRNY